MSASNSQTISTPQSKNVQLIFSQSLQQDFTFSLQEGIIVRLNSNRGLAICKYTRPCAKVSLESRVNDIAISLFDGSENKLLDLEVNPSQFINLVFRNKEHALEQGILLGQMGQEDTITQIVCDVIHSKREAKLQILEHKLDPSF